MNDLLYQQQVTDSYPVYMADIARTGREMQM